MTTQALAAAQAIAERGWHKLTKEQAIEQIATIISAHFPAPSGSADWRPIETAPRDGTYILLGGPSGYTTTPLRVEVCRYDAEYRPLQPWVNHANNSFMDGGEAPACWQPLYGSHETALAGALEDAVNWCNPVSRPPGVSLPEWFVPASDALARYREATGK